MRKEYSRQIIIRFIGNNEKVISALTERISKKSIDPTVKIIDKNTRKLEPTGDSKQRIYIHGHGDFDILYLEDDHKNKYQIQEIVNLLKTLLPKNRDDVEIFSQRPKISLLVCYAASSSSNIQESFAAKLQKLLAEEGRYVDINARKSPMLIDLNDKAKKKTINSEQEETFVAIQKKQLELYQKNLDGNLTKEDRELIQTINKWIKENLFYKAPGSKITLCWGKDINGHPMQIACYAYELKSLKKIYIEIKNFIQLLRDFSENNKNENNNVNTSINILTNCIESITDDYFNNLDSISDNFFNEDNQEDKTREFAKLFKAHVEKINDVLNKHNTRNTHSFSLFNFFKGANSLLLENKNLITENNRENTIDTTFITSEIEKIEPIRQLK